MESNVGGGSAAIAPTANDVGAADAVDGGCYGGGDIAGAVIGSLIGGIVLAYLLYRLYVHYWRNRKGKHLVQEDPENAKQEFAFDNPAFRNEKQKTAGNSPLETKWTFNKKSPEKSHTIDDSGTPVATRSVALRGSDFTGLGIEICGGLKEGIYVRKVMPQGPAAAQTVRCGDRIISITIDLQHMVQEDAATILSYASPYNVQLELVAGNGTLPRMPLASTHGSAANNSSSTTSMAHPLYRASSQENDIGTIEQNTRRNLFPSQQQQQEQDKEQQQQQHEIGNYPTLKLEAPAAGNVAATATTTTTTTTTVHRENEKLQQHASPAVSPNVPTQTHHIDVISVVQSYENKPADIDTTPDDMSTTAVVVVPPPIINKRTKHLSKHTTADNNDTTTKSEPENIALSSNNNTNNSEQFVQAAIHNESAASSSQSTANEPAATAAAESSTTNEQPPNHLQRMVSHTSSGIRRDAAGIPQEIPEQMFAAAMAARGNRKSTGGPAILVAVQQPFDVDGISVTVDDEEDAAAANQHNRTKAAPRPPARGDSLVAATESNINGDKSTSTTVNVSVDAADVTTIDIIDGTTTAGGIAPKNDMLESQLSVVDITDDTVNTSGSISIELNSNHITVHHSSSADVETTPPSRTSIDSAAPIPNKRIHHQQQQQSREQLHHEIRIADTDHKIQSLTVATPSASPPAPVPRSSIISMDTSASSLVEQVLAVADGFTQETRATLSRQLSELNEDHVPTVFRRFDDGTTDDDDDKHNSSSSMDIGTHEEILNNYKFKAEPAVLISMSSSQYQFEDDVEADQQVITNNVPKHNGHDDNSDNNEEHHHVTLSYGINIPDDAKVVSRYPFGASPLLSSASSDQLHPIVPVFSSDGHGVNSISITSMDISADELEHIVSQPSSIIAIDDEDLDFALQSPVVAVAASTPTTTTLPNGTEKQTPLINGNTNDVFIIESLSSMKTSPPTTTTAPTTPVEDVNTEEDDDHHLVATRSSSTPSTSNYVTEIQLTPNHIPASNNISSSTPMPSKNANNNTSPTVKRNSIGTTTTSKLPPPSPPRPKQRTTPPSSSSSGSSGSAQNSVDRIPRNSEIKFTTATYAESATQRHLNADRRQQQQQQHPQQQQPAAAIEQIRSTFERGHTQSEIPVLVRRPSIPASPPAVNGANGSGGPHFTGGGTHSQSTSSLSSLPRTSPSKIPVFSSLSNSGGSTSSSSALKVSADKSGYMSSSSGTGGGSSTGHSPPVQARTNGNGFLYRSHSSLNASAASSRSNSLNGGSGNINVVGGVVTVSAIKNSSRNPSGK